MKRWTVLVALLLALTLCMMACDHSGTPEQTTEQAPATQETDQVTTPEQTTEQPTTEPETTEPETTEPETTEPEQTTEKEVVVHPTLEQIKASATAVLSVEEIMAAANNPQQDWSDFGGLTQNEDGSLTALFRMGTNDIWDPYFYLIKQDTVVDDILVIQYRSDIDQMLNLYIGTHGNAATGIDDHVGGDIYATDGDWDYLVLNLREVANAYDPEASYLGYLRFGLTMAESGDTVDFGFVAFFNTMDQVNMILP